MLAHEKKSGKSVVPDRLVIKGFVLVFLFTILILFGLSWYTWRSNLQLKALATKHFRLLELSGQIIHHDEVLTMSARMAALTGEPKWKERYREFEPKLGAAINEVIKLSAEGFMSEAIAQTDNANVKLVGMENRAFDLIRQGQLETAAKLLHSTEYANEKEVYSHGIHEISDGIYSLEEARLKKEQRIALTSTVFLIITIPLVAFIWFIALRILRRYIVERKRSELALRMSEQRFRAIADYTYFWEVWVSPGGRPIWTNPAVERVTGYSADELIAMQDYPMALVYEDDREKVNEVFQSALKGSTGREMEFRLLRKDGSITWVETAWQPIFDEKGVSQGHRVSMHDITDRKQTEQALHASEEKFRLMFETSPLGMVLCEMDGTLVQANRAYLDIIGYSHEEAIKLSYWDIPSRDYDAAEAEQLRSMKETGRYGPYEKEYICKRGRRVPVLLNGMVVKCANGVERIWSIVEDISERKRAEQHLRESEERYRTLVENIDLGIALIDVDHNIIMANSVMSQMFSYPASEMVGKKCYSRYGRKQGFCDECPSDKAMESGRVEEVETEGVRDDGSVFPIRIRAFPLLDDDGKATGFIEVSEDITVRKRTEQTLRMIVEGTAGAIGPKFFRSLVKSLSSSLGFKYAFIAETINNGQESVKTLAVWAGSGFIANFEYKLVGTPCENIVGKKMCFYPQNARELFPKDHLLRELEVESYGGIPLFASSGQALGLLVVMEDKEMENVPLAEAMLTIFAARASSELERNRVEQSRVRLNEALEVKNKELESIIYAASHDLKSPLVNIQGFGHELSRSCDLIRSIISAKGRDEDMGKDFSAVLDEDVPRALNFISTSTEKMDSLLSGLLDICRLGTVALNAMPIDMNVMMIEVAASMEYQIKEVGAKLDIKPLPPCRGDVAQINRVFSNLLTNALKFLDESRPGLISIYAKRQDDKIIYCVEDNGIGIAPEQQDKIFEIFYQLEPDRKEGQGIGLTIVRRIIDRHNGAIRVESEVGGGSKFFVTLPNV